MKQKAIRNPKHLALVRKNPCMITDHMGENCNQMPVIAHHLTFVKEGGMGKKVGDNWCVPLCHFHHGILHYVGEKTFWAYNGFTLDEVLEYAERLWEITNNK